MRWGAGVLVGCLAVLPGAVARADEPLPPATIAALVNQTRAAHGIPPVTLDEKMSAGCLAHVDYAHANGGYDEADPHDEIPGKPGFSEAGRTAAKRAGLGERFDSLPLFAHAPKHQAPVLAPYATKVGAAQRTAGGKTFGCVWMAGRDADDVDNVRPPRSPARQWSVPANGESGVPFYESADEFPSIAAFDVGLTSSPGGPYTSGPHLFLYHDDPALDTVCAATLLAPGGATAASGVSNDAIARTAIVVPAAPLLPGGRYQLRATHSTAKPCATRQSTTTTSFTVQPRPQPLEQFELSDPVTRDGQPTWVHLEAHDVFGVIGNGTIEISWDVCCGGPFKHRDNAWRFGIDYDFTGFSPGTHITITMTNDALQTGPTCYSPTTVARTYTRTATGLDASAKSVTHPVPDTCGAAPTVTAFAPATGSTGAKVRVNGGGLRHVTGVTFGSVAATAWTTQPDGGLEVSVPTGAKSGPVGVRSGTGAATSKSAFTVLPGSVAQNPGGDPQGKTAAALASVGALKLFRATRGPTLRRKTQVLDLGLVRGTSSTRFAVGLTTRVAGRTLTLGTWKGSAVPGHPVRIRRTVPRATLKRLAGRKTLAAKVALSTRPRSGKPKRVTRSVTIRLR
jgi:hypothetical protein